MLIEALGARVEARELCRQIGGKQLDEAGIFNRSRGMIAAREQDDQGRERDELEGDESSNHFDFPSLGG
jgi:hypothetical protein